MNIFVTKPDIYPNITWTPKDKTYNVFNYPRLTLSICFEKKILTESYKPGETIRGFCGTESPTFDTVTRHEKDRKSDSMLTKM